MTTALIVIACVALTCVVLWAYFTAQRLNSLHIRTDAALAALESALNRRAAVTAALFPAHAGLARQVEAIALKQGDIERRAEAEARLSAAVADGLAGVPANLIDADVRVKLAHRFYNEAVSDTRALRLRPVVRFLRLGGTAPLPDFFELQA